MLKSNGTLNPAWLEGPARPRKNAIYRHLAKQFETSLIRLFEDAFFKIQNFALIKKTLEAVLKTVHS